ncbi:MAG: class I adenylate-forming enzyme family protein, partial [Candidatus Binatia bacterium]
METIGAFLDAVCAVEPEREAVAHAPAECVTARLTRAALRDASRAAAKRLVAAGVGKGTRVGLLCPNRLDWLPLACGALRVGAVLVPFSTLWKRDEIAYGLRHADVALLLTVPRFLKHDYLARLVEIAPGLPSRGAPLYDAAVPALRHVLVLDEGAPGWERWDDLPADLDDAFLDRLEASVSGTDLATIFFTSGTTAQAKAVTHAHAALTTSARRIAECLGVTPDDAWWGHMPLFWSGGFVLGALTTLAGGGRLVLQEVVEPGTALALLEAEGCTIMAGWHQAGPLMAHPDFARRRLKLRKGTYHLQADALMGPGHQTIGVYGMSETATCVTAARFDDPEPIRAGTFGRALPGMEVRIVDAETRQPVAPGETGEILVKGSTLMEGYYRVPRAATLDAEGFFRTGDRGALDAEGNLHFGGRIKDVIKTSGVNVAAVEIEEALARHPAVQTAHVVGVPDATRGESIAALVVLRPLQAAAAEELRSFCREALASYKVPRHLFVVDAAAVPRTGTGKVEKAALR